MNYDWPLSPAGRFIGLTAGAIGLIAAYNRVAMLHQSEDMGRMRWGAKVWPAGVLKLGDLAEGFKWVACMGEGELAYYNMGNFSVKSMGCRSGLGAMICRAATTYAGPLFRFRVEW